MIRTTLCLALLLLAAAPSALAEDAEKAPDFQLKDVFGKSHKLSDFKGKWVVLEWTNYACPFVKKQYHPSHRKMQSLQATYTGKGVVWLTICSSGKGKQGYMTNESGQRALKEAGASPTALLLDPTGKVGRRFGAKTTPDIRIITPRGLIAYQGAIDNKRSANPADVAGSTNYVEVVLDDVLSGQACPISVTKPYG